jgi:hypothetical protein
MISFRGRCRRGGRIEEAMTVVSGVMWRRTASEVVLVMVVVEGSFLPIVSSRGR